MARDTDRKRASVKHWIRSLLAISVVMLSTAMTFATTKVHADSVVDRVINSRGEIMCLILQTGTYSNGGKLNQKTLDQAAEYIMTAPAMKLTKQQGVQVIQGSVETYCPEFSIVIASVFDGA